MRDANSQSQDMQQLLQELPLQPVWESHWLDANPGTLAGSKQQEVPCLKLSSFLILTKFVLIPYHSLTQWL